jgi:ribosomal protein L9
LNMAPKASGKDKIRVRLLVDIKGVGQNGDIVMIGSTQFLNVFQPKKQAELISDDQMKKIEAQRADVDAKAFDIATDLSTAITSLSKINIKRKIGKAGKLFGSVNIKHIMEELNANVDLKVISEKSMSLVELKEGDLDHLKVGEIRTSGSFSAKIRLHPKIAPAAFSVDIIAE